MVLRFSRQEINFEALGRSTFQHSTKKHVYRFRVYQVYF